MRIRKVLLSTKKTALEHFKEHSDFLEDILPARELREIRIAHEAHYATLDSIRRSLADHGIDFARSYMPYSEYEDFEGKDLIICVGGDGTVLNSSQYIRDRTPVLAVRSDKKSVGALCEIDASEFEVALNRLLMDDFKLEEWSRVEGRFRNKRLLALNEIYVGTRHSPSMARYELSFGGKREWQMSSGLVISSGTGSSGWYRNIPGSQGKFPRTAKELRFIVREHNIAARYKLTRGTIRPDGKLVIRSKMNIDGAISFDGDAGKRMFDFNRGDTLEVRLAQLPMCVVKLGRR
jgi:NAD kinase